MCTLLFCVKNNLTLDMYNIYGASPARLHQILLVYLSLARESVICCEAVYNGEAPDHTSKRMHGLSPPCERYRSITGR